MGRAPARATDGIVELSSPAPLLPWTLRVCRYVPTIAGALRSGVASSEYAATCSGECHSARRVPACGDGGTAQIMN
jgi:hypothetical protein